MFSCHSSNQKVTGSNPPQCYRCYIYTYIVLTVSGTENLLNYKIVVELSQDKTVRMREPGYSLL